MKEILLTRGKVALVSNLDYPRVSKFKWYALWNRCHWYAVRSATRRRYIYMHRFILDFPKGSVDHRDRDGLNNQRRNLRRASQTQNNANMGLRKDNTSGFKGVSLHRTGKWSARIRAHGKQRYLGLFTTPKEASRAYERAAKKTFGEFARI